MPTDVDIIQLTALVDEDPTDPAMTLKLGVYISMANSTFATLLGKLSLDDDTIIGIKTQLAGHYYTLGVHNGGLVEDKVSTETSQQYRKVDASKIGFMSTTFGQMAVMLDTSNILKDASNPYKRKVAIHNVY